MKGNGNAAGRCSSEGRPLRWTRVLEGDVRPFRGDDGTRPSSAAGDGVSDALREAPQGKPAQVRSVTAVIFRNGEIWDAAIELPEPSSYPDEFSYYAACIALFDMSVDEGIRQHS